MLGLKLHHVIGKGVPGIARLVTADLKRSDFRGFSSGDSCSINVPACLNILPSNSEAISISGRSILLSELDHMVYHRVCDHPDNINHLLCQGSSVVTASGQWVRVWDFSKKDAKQNEDKKATIQQPNGVVKYVIL